MRLAPALDPATRTLEAEVQLHNDGGDLRPGLYGHAAIIVEVHPHMAVVPSGALQRTEHGTFAFVINADTAHRRPVTIGVEDEDWVEVKSGLQPGEDVVVAGIESLSEGVKVRTTRGVDPYTGARDNGGVTNGADSAPAAAAAPVRAAAP
jgi:RND family efflux transporter MFP subunit